MSKKKNFVTITINSLNFISNFHIIVTIVFHYIWLLKGLLASILYGYLFYEYFHVYTIYIYKEKYRYKDIDI